MLSSSNELKKLINEEIISLNDDIKSVEEDAVSLEKLYKKLSKDINNITNIPKKELKSAIDKLDIEGKDSLYKDILTVQKILTMNKEYDATLRLFDRNEKAYNVFVEELSKYGKDSELVKSKISIIKKRQNDYEKLIEKIDTDKFKLDKKTLDLLYIIFNKNTDSEARRVLAEIMNIELDTYTDTLSHSKKKEVVQVSEEDLVQIFNKYGYKYKSLEDEYKEYLEKHGNLNNIDEVFASLKNNHYPHIDDNYKLTSILLGSSKLTIDTVTEFSREHHLIPKSLLDISGALLEQKNVEENLTDYDYMVTGSSIDFMQNILTIKQTGLSINYIFQKCRSILTMSNKLLKYNIDLFHKYGFSFEYKKRGIIDPSPDALLSVDFAEICDAFIEIHPDGLKYLTDNLSNVKTVSNPDALMFYNIYLSEKNSSKELSDDPNNGPFRKVLEENNENYQLKAIITRNRPDYRGTPYEGITEENKKEKTGTIDINIKGMKKFKRIIDENKYPEISDAIFTNPYIESIDKYISEDSALIYDFKGVRISRLKVLRIYDTLLRNGVENGIDSFMYAIFYNTIISEADYKKVVSCIKKEVEIR